MVEEIADSLEEYAEFLCLDGQEGRAHAYDKAARALRQAGYAPPDPARLDGIGGSTRNAVIELENGMGIDELEELREKYPWHDEFREVKHIGVSRAEKIHETLGINELDKLILAAENGDLTIVSGIGPKTQEKILDSAKEVRNRKV